MLTHRQSATGMMLGLCLAGLVCAWGCAPQLVPTRPLAVPGEIDTLLEGRGQVAIGENDPRFSAEPGVVVDDLGGLDGCWASYTTFSGPDDVPALLGALEFDTYEFYDFDAATGSMTWLIYGELSNWSLANLVEYEGTFELAGDNRLAFTVEHMTATNSATDEILTYPEGLMEHIDQLAADENLTEEERAELLAEFENGLSFDFLVTLDGDQVTLVPVWEYEENGELLEDFGHAHVAFRVDCPE